MSSKANTESLITDECTHGFEKLSPGGENLTDFVVISQNPEKRSGLDKALPDRIPHEIRGLMEIQLIHNAGAVTVGCLDADAQTRCDFLGGISFGYERHHLPLSIG